MEQLEKMTTVARGTSHAGMADVLRQVHEEDQGQEASDEDVVSAPLWVSNSPSRGLEKELPRPFLSHHQTVVSQVLHMLSQKEQRHGDESIRDTYQTLSQPYARFSRLVAHGDVLVVQSGQDEHQC
jgi:hypothetical protein